MDGRSWVPVKVAGVLIEEVLNRAVIARVPVPEHAIHGAVADQRVVVEVQTLLHQLGQSFHVLPWKTCQSIGREVQHGQERMAVTLDREEREVSDPVQAEVDRFQAAQTAQRAGLHLCDPIVEETELLQPPQPLEGAPPHHTELVGRQIEQPEPRDVEKGVVFQSADSIVAHPEVFQSGHLVEAARTQPGEVVVAEVEGDGEGWEGVWQLSQTPGATAYCVG